MSEHGGRAKRTRWAWCAATLAIGAFAVVSAGCGTKTVPASGGEDFINKYFSQFNLGQPKSVDCPSGTEAKVGNTFECNVTLSTGQVVTYPLKVESISGDTVRLTDNFDVVSNPLAVSVVYQQLMKLGQPQPKSVDCPTDQPAKVGETVECHVTLGDGSTATFTLKVDTTSASNQHLTFVHAQKTS